MAAVAAVAAGIATNQDFKRFATACEILKGRRKYAANEVERAEFFPD